MERYTADEALDLITDGSGLGDDGESDIGEDPEFLLPQVEDEPPADEPEPETLSPSHTTSHSLLSATCNSTPQATSASKINKFI